MHYFPHYCDKNTWQRLKGVNTALSHITNPAACGLRQFLLTTRVEKWEEITLSIKPELRCQMQWKEMLAVETVIVNLAVIRKLAWKLNLLLLIFVNKDLLEYSCTYSVICAYDFSHCISRVELQQRLMACKTQDVYHVIPDAVLLFSIEKIKAHGE